MTHVSVYTSYVSTLYSLFMSHVCIYPNHVSVYMSHVSAYIPCTRLRVRTLHEKRVMRNESCQIRLGQISVDFVLDSIILVLII